MLIFMIRLVFPTHFGPWKCYSPKMLTYVQIEQLQILWGIEHSEFLAAGKTMSFWAPANWGAS